MPHLSVELYPVDWAVLGRAGPCSPYGANSSTTSGVPSRVQVPRRLTMLTCLPILFISSISETRSSRSESEKFSGNEITYSSISD